jgi:branched-chain amino acid transport system substrate-binding protein
MKAFATAAICIGLLASSSVDGWTQVSDDVVKIGVLDDMSGLYADIQGPGDVVAVKLAVEDFGGSVNGKPIEVVSGDLQNKADVGSAIARRWYDTEKVDAILGLGNSAVAIAVQGISQEKNRIAITTAAGSTVLTGKACAPLGIHWVYDTYALAKGTARAMMKQGGADTWFFITTDYAFGHALEADTSAVVKANGGQVLGAVRAPINTSDFSSFILQAQASKAKVIGFANAGADTVNAIKTAAEFGLVAGGTKLAGLLVLLTDVRTLGLKTAQGLTFTEAFYWNQSDETRAFSKRFAERHGGKPPTMFQAGIYSAAMHYLKAVKAAGTDEANAVVAAMKKIPVNDFMTKNGTIREDGRMMRDMYLLEAKKPSESDGPWDLMKVVATIPAEEAFRPLSESDCPLVKK